MADRQKQVNVRFMKYVSEKQESNNGGTKTKEEIRMYFIFDL